ncbi:transcription factor bHLH18-like [Nicotiana sylvestris]|uniref:Transcription factor bHLH18-like n=1 Tax=Nicotiana sylvestris TaxID=4096 RepID=A0A1U7W5Y1_NICSY|nr:PREDICTED: transcription factor bHLH18-like [Nicotiana sylvestris]
MDDLALIFSHHNHETSRKRLHEDEKAAALACIISFNTTTPNSSQYYSSTKAEANQQQKQIQCNHTKWGPGRIICTTEANPNTINFSPFVYQNGGTARRTGEQAEEHLLAERKRRQKMTKLFVSLASLLPGLTKMDKASILEGATSFIRQIREKTETMKGHLKTKTNNEKGAVPAVKKARNYEHQYSIDMSILPEIEIRSLEEEVLITVYCKKKYTGIIDEILGVIQKLHLTIKSSNFMSFGSTAIHITVVAQMKDEFCETTDCLAEKLRQSILKTLR